MDEKPTDNAQAAADLSAATTAYLDLWERHAAAIFRDNPWRGPRFDVAQGAADAPGDENGDGGPHG